MPSFTTVEDEAPTINVRTLVLQPIDGKPLSSTGNVDPRLFKGGNNCRVFMDDQTGLWYFKLDVGGLPEPLKNRYTSFAQAKKHAETYFRSRNIEIIDVVR